jgi:fibronectin type 3 domain-containing protein
MHRGRTRLFAFLCATILLGGCDKKPPFAPDGDPSLSASPGDPLNLTSTAVSPTQINLAWQDTSARESGFELHRSTTGPDGPFTARTTTGPNVTSVSDVGLTAATQYCYQIRSFRITGRKTSYSGFSNTTCATTQDPPPPPPGPSAPSGTNARPANSLFRAVQVTWTDNSTDENGFRVQRAPSDQGPWELAATLSRDNTSHIDYGRPLEQQLCYRVIAFYTAGGESASNVDCTYLPATPTGLTATAVGGEAIDLAWVDNSAHEDGYDIERSETGGWPFTTVASVGANTTTFHDATVSANKTYTYRVWVTREGARAGASNEARAITASEPPLAPSGVNAIPYGSTAVQVSWTDNSANESGFRAERSDNGGATWVTAASTPYPGFYDAGRTSDQQVCYRAIAFNTVGDSPPSSIDCTAPPAAPSGLVATTAPGLAIDLTWTDNSSVEDGYDVQRRFEYCYYGCYEYYASIATLGPNATSYRDAGVNFGEYHSYVVVALKDGGVSDQSNVASAYSQLPPAAPSNLTAVAVSGGQVDLAWTDNSTDESNFLVTRCTGGEAACGDESFVGIAWASGANATTFSDTTVQPNTTYTYRVLSCHSQCSGPSNKATATTPP